jgi:hypothetical protein
VNDDFQIIYDNLDVKQDFNDTMWATFSMASKPPMSLNNMNKKQAAWRFWQGQYLNKTKTALAELNAEHAHFVHPHSHLSNITTKDGCLTGRSDG